MLPRASGLQHRFERLEEARILALQTDRHTQVIGHGVAGERAHDHAPAQQLLEHRSCLALLAIARDFDGDEITVRRNPGDAQALASGQQLRHTGNPVMTWCAANAVVVSDPAGNRKIAKDKSTGRVDGIVAACMSIGRAKGKQEQYQIIDADYEFMVI